MLDQLFWIVIGYVAGQRWAWASALKRRYQSHEIAIEPALNGDPVLSSVFLKS